MKPKPNKNATNTNNATASNASGTNSKPHRRLKVELPTLRLTEDAEKLLYETLKQVCGEVNFRFFIFKINFFYYSDGFLIIITLLFFWKKGKFKFIIHFCSSFLSKLNLNIKKKIERQLRSLKSFTVFIMALSI